MRIVLMGMPGVGKGTQASLLRKTSGVPHVATGDILREAVREGSVLGQRVKDVLEAGQLVPDELVGRLIVERLERADARDGFILDGFPRTTEQVKILDSLLQQQNIGLDGVYLLGAPEQEIVRRLSGRRVCPGCSAVFHLDTNSPASAGVCDNCGSALVQRSDDTESVIRERLRVYDEQTRPLVAIYRERGLLVEVDSSGSPESVAERLTEAVSVL